MRQRRWLVPVLPLALAAVMLLAPLPRSWGAGWRSELLNFGHVPLFAGAVVSLRLWFRSSIARPAFLAVLLAGLAEIVQHFFDRSASFADFLYGVCGSLAGAGLIRAANRRSWRRASAWLGLAVVFVAWPIVRSGPVLLDAVEGHRDFPILADFRTEREMKRWEARQATLQREPECAGVRSARLTFRPGPEPYPSAVLTPVVRNLSDYRWLCCEFAVESEPLELVLSIRGGPDDSGHSSHYQVARRFSPGDHVARLDLPAVAPLALPRPLDLADIWFVQLFVVKPDSPRTICVRRIWMEN